MKNTVRLLLPLMFLPVFLVSGCVGGSGGAGSPAPGFSVQYKYGAPGALTPDPYNVYASGNAVTPYVNCPAYCNLTFGGYDDSNGIYNVVTGYIGNQYWNVQGGTTNNCINGYPTNTVEPNGGQVVPEVCADQTAYFRASRESWQQTSPPSSVLYTATHSVFPGSGYTPSLTNYDVSGNNQGTGIGKSTSATTLSMTGWNGSTGQHVVIFRNPSTNQVMGAGAYYIIYSNPCSVASGPRLTC